MLPRAHVMRSYRTDRAVLAERGPLWRFTPLRDPLDAMHSLSYCRMIPRIPAQVKTFSGTAHGKQPTRIPGFIGLASTTSSGTLSVEDHSGSRPLAITSEPRSRRETHHPVTAGTRQWISSQCRANS